MPPAPMCCSSRYRPATTVPERTDVLPRHALCGAPYCTTAGTLQELAKALANAKPGGYEGTFVITGGGSRLR
ncbi:hypothetical protein GCM10022247_00300 [Allokutzneria multivorans]|uniref:Uncharacterized protein n=1 Tax=Allokutzneria multivorans TaxID=1142134 RepID=A0ABP7QPP4_9PSEU